MNNHKEIILLGSGPIGLIKAYLLLKDKTISKITIIDSAKEAGGAWYSEISPKGKQIECGCHIWSYCPTAYNFIEKELGVELFTLSPKPIFSSKYINLPYPIKNTIDSYKIYFKNVLKLNFKKIKKLKNQPSVNLKLLNKNNKYPKLGSPELINKLTKILNKDNRITFVFNQKIEEININENSFVRSGKTFYNCDKIYVTSTSFLNELKFKNNKLKPKNNKADYIHYLIELNKKPKKKTSYIRSISDDIIHRVTDISYQTLQNETLFLIGIKALGHKNNSQKQIMAKITNLLMSYKIIDNSHTITFIKEHIYPTFYIDHKTRADINSLDSNKIELIHSTDLMYGIHHLLEKHHVI